ncbi:hypothetical protein AB4P97_05570 [Pseudomonas sp. A1230]|uniref:hypothetical protein n=1 Tax=Pseudomonas sp. A1230 TaxID=3235106 RepID=UPI003783A78D
MDLSTKDSWAKIERARFHLSEIYNNFYGYIDGDLLDIPTLKIPNFEGGYISVVIKQLPVDSIVLPLVLGDAIHNYRSALDYLWWQFAKKKLGRDPTDREAPKVQFPLLSREDDWGRRYFDYVFAPDVEYIKKYQPFNAGNGEYSALEALREISNHDKHRTLNPLMGMANESALNNLSKFNVKVEVMNLPDVLEPGVEVFRVHTEIEAINVECDIEVYFKVYLAVQNGWNILTAFEAIDEQCEKILKEAEKML